MQWIHEDFWRGSDRWCYRTSMFMETSTHGGIHPRRVHEEVTFSIPPRPSPMKDLPHLGISSRSRRSPCPYKLLGSTPHHVGGSQATPNQSRRHHSLKGNRWCVDEELLALVLQMIVSSTLDLSHTDLAWVGEGLDWKAT